MSKMKCYKNPMHFRIYEIALTTSITAPKPSLFGPNISK